MNDIVYTTETSRPALQRRVGQRIEAFGTLSARDANRVPPTAAVTNVRGCHRKRARAAAARSREESPKAIDVADAGEVR
jgi:hypothetical protein